MKDREEMVKYGVAEEELEINKTAGRDEKPDSEEDKKRTIAKKPVKHDNNKR